MSLNELRVKKYFIIESIQLNSTPLETTHSLSEIQEKLIGEKITVSGRIKFLREIGSEKGVYFIVITRGNDQLQLFYEKNNPDQLLKTLINNLDLGDLVCARGLLDRSRSGDLILKIENYSELIVTKCLVGIPDSKEGLTDLGLRYAQRHLDFLANPSSFEIMRLRFSVLRKIREFMWAKGYTESDTPILVPNYDGFSADAFKTHLIDKKENLFLTNSPEIKLKQYLIGGFDKIFRIGSCFRNESIDSTHHPEFNTIEFYTCYKEFPEILDLIKSIVSLVAKEILGTTEISLDNGKKFDLSGAWNFNKFSELILSFAGTEDPLLITKKLKDLGYSETDLEDQDPTLFYFDKIIEPTLIEPTFTKDMFLSGALLARRINETLCEQIEGRIDGVEIINLYREQNQLIRLIDNYAGATDKMNPELYEAMKYGFPPCIGVGIGIDRLLYLFMKRKYGIKSIKDIIPFSL